MRFSVQRLNVIVLLGVVAILLLPATALTQGGMWPGGGGGGFPGGGFPGGGFPGGGGFRSRDPNERWNQYTGGKDVWRRSEITDPDLLRRFDFYAGSMGIATGEITRDQYVNWSNQRRAMSGFGGMTPGGTPPSGAPAPSSSSSAQSPPPGGPPGAPGAANWMDTMIEARFRSYDQNGDGLLNNDEMPESLKAERDKWDTNHDGFIDLNEFKAYALARIQQMQADRGGGGGWGGWGGSGGAGAAPAPPIPLDDDVDKRPTVYRAGNLPKDIPSWFTEADADGDGQVGLYEWRAKGWPLDQFQQIDRNNDGFITVDEALRWQKQQAGGVLTASTQGTEASPSPGGPPTAGPGPGGPGPGGAAPGGPGPGGRPSFFGGRGFSRGGMPGGSGGGPSWGGRGGSGGGPSWGGRDRTQGGSGDDSGYGGRSRRRLLHFLPAFLASYSLMYFCGFSRKASLQPEQQT